MSTFIPTSAAGASVAAAAETTTSTTPTLSLRRRHSHPHSHSHSHSHSNVLFPLSSKPKLRLFSQSKRPTLSHTVATKAQLSNVGGDGSSSPAAPQSKPETSSQQESKNGKLPSESVPKTFASEDSISEFITQVASLVKLVDSRDIVELQLKQHDYEVLIRKKEAIAQTSPPPVIMMQSPSSPTVAPQATPPVSSSVASPPPPPPPVVKPAKPSVPPLKSPMAGTFYRSPAPGAPAFVKVGDKVQKGQVLCIIEAMKLMNEIEADQPGTVVEILAEDGKPVSVDTPLFAIQP